MEWSDLRIFLVVARSGSLTGSARRLGLTQPTIGRRIRALEASAGHALFQRGREGLRLTDEGLLVLDRAERMEHEALSIERQLAGQRGEMVGALRISAPDWLGTQLLTTVCARFIRAHPQLQVALSNQAQPMNLARREADIVFTTSQTESADIVQRRVLSVRCALYGGRGSRRPQVGDGAGATMMTLDGSLDGSPGARWITRTFPNATRTFASNSHEVQAQMCALGAGYAVLPRLLGDRSDHLLRHDLGCEPPGCQLWLAYHHDLRGLARLRAFIDMALSILDSPELPQA